MADSDQACKTCGIVKTTDKFPTGKMICTPCRVQHNNNRINSGSSGFLRRQLTVVKNRSSKKAHEFDLTIEYLQDMWADQNSICAISGLPMIPHLGSEYAASIDRVDSDKGYTKDNVRLVCMRANLMKNYLADHDLIWWCRAVVNNLGN